MLNSSEKNAACGPYIAEWTTSPTVIAAHKPAVVRVSTSQKNGNAKSASAAAPARYTGRRPTRSESAPKSGIATSCTAEPTSTACNTSLFVAPSFVVA